MKKLLNYLTGVDGLPRDVAWVLVDHLYDDLPTLMAGAVGVLIFGLVGFSHSGSPLYLSIVGYTLLVFLWRLYLQTRFVRADRSLSPLKWSLQRLYSALAFGLGWGAMTLTIPYEHDQYVTACMIGTHAFLTTGGILRNGTIRPIAIGQNILACFPMFLLCALSGHFALQAYSAMTLLQFIFGVRLSKTLRQQTIDLLIRDREKTEIAQNLATANRDLAEANQRLAMMAGTDALTEVANRRAFDLILAREWRRAERELLPLSLILIDVDYFKAYNDMYGHPAGDTCLRDVAATIAQVVNRPLDTVARYGGEEFAVVLPGTLPEGALHIAQEILVALSERALQHDGSPFCFVTLSVGVASAHPALQVTTESLIARADAALYAAKRSGRNSVHLAESESVYGARTGDVLLGSSPHTPG